ncbi:hypothetical protein pb186bvf_006312 [Paramecium bursaria]
MNQIERHPDSIHQIQTCLRLEDCEGQDSIFQNHDNKQIKFKDHIISPIMSQFYFDHVFYHRDNNIILFQTFLMPLLEKFIIGQDLVIYTYGLQRKTKTLQGSDIEEGVIQTSAKFIFDHLSNDKKFKMMFKYHEIIENQIFDLLYQKSKVKQELQIYSYNQFQKLYNTGSSQRKYGYNPQGQQIPIGHSVLEICLYMNSNSTQQGQKLLFVELAGQQEFSKMKTQYLSEKKDLITFYNMVGFNEMNLGSFSKQILPTQISLLTNVLQLSIKQRFQQAYIFTINQTIENFDESLFTLSFSQKVNEINIMANQNILALEDQNIEPVQEVQEQKYQFKDQDKEGIPIQQVKLDLKDQLKNQDEEGKPLQDQNIQPIQEIQQLQYQFKDQDEEGIPIQQVKLDLKEQLKNQDEEGRPLQDIKELLHLLKNQQLENEKKIDFLSEQQNNIKEKRYQEDIIDLKNQLKNQQLAHIETVKQLNEEIQNLNEINRLLFKEIYDRHQIKNIQEKERKLQPRAKIVSNISMILNEKRKFFIEYRRKIQDLKLKIEIKNYDYDILDQKLLIQKDQKVYQYINDDEQNSELHGNDLQAEQNKEQVSESEYESESLFKSKLEQQSDNKQIVHDKKQKQQMIPQRQLEENNQQQDCEKFDFNNEKHYKILEKINIVDFHQYFANQQGVAIRNKVILYMTNCQDQNRVEEEIFKIFNFQLNGLIIFSKAKFTFLILMFNEAPIYRQNDLKESQYTFVHIDKKIVTQDLINIEKFMTLKFCLQNNFNIFKEFKIQYTQNDRKGQIIEFLLERYDKEEIQEKEEQIMQQEEEMAHLNIQINDKVVKYHILCDMGKQKRFLVYLDKEREFITYFYFSKIFKVQFYNKFKNVEINTIKKYYSTHYQQYDCYQYIKREWKKVELNDQQLKNVSLYIGIQLLPKLVSLGKLFQKVSVYHILQNNQLILFLQLIRQSNLRMYFANPNRIIALLCIDTGMDLKIMLNQIKEQNEVDQKKKTI